MTNIPKTPSKPSAPRRCDGLLVQLSGSGSKAKSLARLRKVVKSSLNGSWRIELINHADRLYELIRTKPSTQPTIRSAFQMVRELEAQSEIENAEMGAIVPGSDPEIEQVFPKAQAKAVAKGFGKDTHKPCSDIEEWALAQTAVQSAWALPLPSGGKAKGKGIVIAHPDTGYTLHPELTDGGRVLAHRGYDFEDNKTDPIDPLVGKAPGHGTSTGSVIISTTGDQTPANPHYVTGVAPEASLIPIRISSSVVHLSFRRLIRAIYLAIDENAHVISLSLGGPFASPALKLAIKAAIDRGIIIISAAGNVWPHVIYPARLPSVVAVAASNCVKQPWKRSARGKTVDVSAPGESIWRAKPLKKGAAPFTTSRSHGTSYATAMVAGMCALWLAHHGRTKLIKKYGKENLAGVFQELIRKTVSKPSGWKKTKYGTGIVDATKLLSEPLPAKSTIVQSVAKKSLPSELNQLLELFPEVRASQMKVVLAKMFGVKPSALGREMASYMNEFSYLVASNTVFRHELIRRAKAKKVSAPTVKFLRKAAVLGSTLSPELAKRLEGKK
ncbi:MAG: S8 family serine peptidase [Gammaproteobacteria bacterium]